ncbi:uncharacterized protein LOC113314292 [Papaver somniferum]|uniref:uncharacterized protein LOC113313965 n=1 Tax=Papaver somniferum TaxID=3469 RepID=UPI000E6FBCF1|nr:uncharacterized protein LOC113313965 [Papaver somniferum]XP_026418866.1 uncharacterized protein LOC113314292 [Papaver somniferum]
MFKEIGEAEVNDIDSKNPESLMEFAILHSNLNCPDCFPIGLDDCHSIFDRSKRIPNSFDSYEQLIVQWISSLGYQLDFSCIQSIVRLCINDAAILAESTMFDKMSESVNLSGVGVAFLLQLKIGKVFDRGKESDNNFLLGSVLLEIYNGGLVCELFPRHEYQYELHFLNSLSLGFVYVVEIGGGWKLGSVRDDFHFQLQKCKVSNTTIREMHSARWLYDRGKGYFNFADAHSLVFDTHSSGVIILIGWIFLDAHCANLVFVILAEFGHCLDLLFAYSHMSLLVKNGEENLVDVLSKRTTFLFLLWAAVVSFNKAYKWYAHVLGMKRADFFFLHLKCALLEVIDRQNGDVHQIILHQFRKLSVLLLSVHIYDSTRLYLARNDSCQHFPSITSEIYDRIMIQQGVRQFILSSLHLSSFSCDFSILEGGSILHAHYMHLSS